MSREVEDEWMEEIVVLECADCPDRLYLDCESLELSAFERVPMDIPSDVAWVTDSERGSSEVWRVKVGASEDSEQLEAEGCPKWIIGTGMLFERGNPGDGDVKFSHMTQRVIQFR